MTVHRRVWTMELLDGAEAAYEKAHAEVWPELLAQMRESGVRRFFLHRTGRTIYAFQERDTPFGQSSLPPSEISRRWWAAMEPLMVTHADGRPVHTELREVFALDTTLENTS